MVKMKFKDAPVGARFRIPNSNNKDVWVKLNSYPKGINSDGRGLVVKWNGNVEGYQSYCSWVDEENGYNYNTEIELISDTEETITKVKSESVLPVHDIRNKLSPITYLIDMVELDKPDLVKKAIPQAKVSVNYLAQRRVYNVSSIPVEKWGVHRTHCCVKHGCKYGDDDCPVELGLLKQDYPCEFCENNLHT